MTITVKLPAELEQALRRQCAAEGRNLSDVLRDALTAYLADAPAAPASAWSLGADLFGRHAGPADLAANRRAQLGEAWAQKHARRRASR